MPVNTTIKIRKGTESEWVTSNPILASGEPGYVIDTNRFKIGNGTTNWNSLSYSAIVPSGFLAGSGINITNGSLGISTTVSIGSHTHVVEDITNFASGVADEVNTSLTSGSGILLDYNNISDTLTINVSGLNTSYLSDFNSAVSGLLPVKDIVAGTGMSVSSSSGIYTIVSTGSGVLAEQSSSLVTTAFNNTASTIPKMSAVYINGGQGDTPTIQLAIATGDPTSAGTYGLTRESIASMSTGKVTVLGALTGLNTDQFNPTAPVGNVNGTILYLSPTVSGGLTTTKPHAPDHIVALGTIVRTHQNEGIIEVRVQNGFELEELHDVAVTGVTNGQVLQYNSNTQLWVPSSSGNFTTLQVSGTAVPTGTGNSGHVAYWTGTNSLSYDSNQLYWDATNNRLGIGTSSPASSLTVSGTIQLTDTAGNRVQFFRGGGTVYDYSIAKEGNHLAVSTANDGSTFRYTQFGYHSGSTWTPKTVINNYNGYIGIGTTTPSVSLQVIGSGIFTSGVRVGDSSSNAYLIGPSGNTYIRFNNGAFNWIELASNTYSGSSTYLSTQYSYLNSAATYVNGTFQFPKAGNVPTSTATQRDSNSIIMYNRLWNGSAESAPGNEILSKASTSVNLRSRFSFLMQNEDGTANRTERFSILSNGYVGVGNTAPSYSLDVVGTGNFSQNLLVNGTGVSISGHTHVVNDITDFSTGVADEVNTTLTAGSGIVLDYDSGTDALTIHTSGVRSKTLTYFTPLDNQPPASAFATLDTRNSIAVLDFDDTTQEAAVFVGVIPENAALGSGISVRIHWTATSATTGSCRWGVQFEKMNTDLDSDSFDTATEAHSATNGTSGIITTTSITCTSIDSLAAGDLFRIKIYRDVTDTTNDTMTGDAEVVAIELRSVL